jgi:hypothetical protein
MQILRLTATDTNLLAARFSEHGNSHRRMSSALSEAGAATPLARLNALRALERRFDIDLGSICFRFLRRHDSEVHPIERLVVQYVTRVGRVEQGAEELWVLLDHVRRVRELMKGRLVGEPER